MSVNCCFDVSRLVKFMILYIVFVPEVLAYYCNHDLCREDQYCCGDNLCCDYVYSLWYFWLGVVFLVIILSLCGGFFRYCYDNNSYVILQTCKPDYYPPQALDDEEKALSSGIEERNSSPPPTYPGNYEKDYDVFTAHQATGSSRAAPFQSSHCANLLVHFN